MTNKNEFKDFVLKRTGMRPVKFKGELLCSVEGRFFAGKEQNRYFDISLYQTTDDKYVVYIEYFTTWQGEEYKYYADICTNGEEIELFLADTFSECAANCRDSHGLKERYNYLVSEILVDEVFAKQV